MKASFKPILLIFCVVLFSFSIPGKKKVLWMIGDSTMAIKSVKNLPETGWGMPFKIFFDSSVSIENHARNGQSTGSFIKEDLWKPVAENMKSGDYVFIQFGHNDEVKEKIGRYTTPGEYTANLTRFISEARLKNATPILLTPVSRRNFVNGKQVETHEAYSKLVRKVAADLKVPFIDLDVKSQELYQQLGEEPSKLLFLHLKPNEHPNYPDGKTDNTHFSELGARLVAQLVLAEMRKLNLDLTNHLVKKK